LYCPTRRPKNRFRAKCSRSAPARSGTEVKLSLGDKEVLVMREDDLMGIIED